MAAGGSPGRKTIDEKVHVAGEAKEMHNTEHFISTCFLFCLELWSSSATLKTSVKSLLHTTHLFW